MPPSMYTSPCGLVCESSGLHVGARNCGARSAVCDYCINWVSGRTNGYPNVTIPLGRARMPISGLNAVSGDHVPTKRRQNTPSRATRPKVTTRGRNASVRPSVKSTAKPSVRKGTAQGFSTSLPGRGPKGPQPPQTFGPAFGEVASGVTKSALEPKVLLTRRHLVVGAAAIGGVAAIGGGATYAIGQLTGGKEPTVSSISVAEGDVETLSSYEQASYSDHVKVSGRFKMPYGTLVWADNDTVAAFLTPGESASPLNTAGVLFLSNGKSVTTLKSAQGTDEGYEIIDVRCSEEGMVWTESNTYLSSWRVYTAKLSNSELSGITMVDSGDANWQMPSLSAVGQYAFWQVSPNQSGSAANERSALKAARFGSNDVSVPCTSKKAFATRVTAATDGVVATPRAEATGTYYTLTKISANDLSVADTMTLPSSMSPDLAGYGRSGFSFGFSNIYSYGGGIANLGTYTPRSAVQAYNYDGKQWFRFARTPMATPCWSGEWFVVKSTTALCCVNFANKCYFTIDTVSGSDDYGEHLVSSGTCSSFVGLSQITSDTNSDEDHALVRVFTPISGSIGSAL